MGKDALANKALRFIFMIGEAPCALPLTPYKLNHV